MNEFDKVEQSYRRRGLPSLFSDTLHVELLLGPSKEEVYDILNSFGSGRKKSKLVRNVQSGSLIAVENQPDNLCLFLAIALTIQHKKVQEIENRAFRKTQQKHFDRLSTGEGYYKQMRNQMSRALLNSIINIGFAVGYNLPAYSVEEHVPIVQEYFYQLPTEERCRLVVFEEVFLTEFNNYFTGRVFSMEC